MNGTATCMPCDRWQHWFLREHSQLLRLLRPNLLTESQWTRYGWLHQALMTTWQRHTNTRHCSRLGRSQQLSLSLQWPRLTAQHCRPASVNTQTSTHLQKLTESDQIMNSKNKLHGETTSRGEWTGQWYVAKKPMGGLQSSSCWQRDWCVDILHRYGWHFPVIHILPEIRRCWTNCRPQADSLNL